MHNVGVGSLCLNLAVVLLGVANRCCVLCLLLGQVARAGDLRVDCAV